MTHVGVSNSKTENLDLRVKTNNKQLTLTEGLALIEVAHQCRADVRYIAGAQVDKVLKQIGGDQEVNDCISQELKPLIGAGDAV